MNEPKKISETRETRQAVLRELALILKKVTEKRASDLHLKAGLPPIVRVNGNLYYLGENKDGDLHRMTANELNRYAYALMNTRQREKYENGDEIDLGFELPSGGRFRINLCQQRSNPRMVCRHIPDAIRSIRDLGIPPMVEQLALAKRGLILVTGSTGSGKSTTLAGIIDYIARSRSCHILTIEDPIEFVFKDRKSIVTQREVGLDSRTFSSALKYALRQDPDVILVGEMRDEETIMMALNAAETGHLVLSTLHTSDASETINRILGSVSQGTQASVRAQIASVLVAVISQRLVKHKDGQGRIPAVEVLISNVRVKEMIADPARTVDLVRAIEEGASVGMQSFDQSLMILYQKGFITEEEALLNCTNVRDFQLRLEGIVGGNSNWQGNSDDSQSIDRAEQVKQAMNQRGENNNIQLDLDELLKKAK
jgi:twitching motility protein PilT